MSKNKKLYKDYCERETDIPLFLSYNWLNNTLGNEEWDVAIVMRGNEVIASFVYYIRKSYGHKILGNPPLTPYLGPWITYPAGLKNSSRINFEKEILTSLIQQLPPFDRFDLKFVPCISNWYPFFLKGFKGTTQYTYILKDLKNIELLYSNLNENIKRQIKKANKVLSVRKSDTINNLYNIKSNAAQINKVPIGLNKHQLTKIYSTCQKYNCGEILEAVDSNGKIYASILYVWDKNTSYYLFGGIEPENRKSGAISLLLWEAIKLSSEKVNEFNFEGSMIESVEQYFRGFGGIQTPYFRINKNNGFLFKLKDFFKEVIQS
ncbi:MAG TPA: GNAT family N-acetyltransferase [Cytophagaceae bacterium]